MEKVKLKRHFVVWVCILAILLTMFGQLLGLFLMAPFKSFTKDSGWLFLLDYGSFTGIWVLVLLYMYFMEKPFLKRFLEWKGLFAGILIGFGLNLACALFAMLTNNIAISFDGFNLIYLLVALFVVLIQSGAEEAVCRAFMLDTLTERYGFWFAAVTNSLLFGALHLMNPGITVLSFLEIVFIGFALSIIVHYFRGFWIVAGIHAGWNYMQNFVLGLPNSGIVSERAIFHLDAASDSLWYSVNFGIEGSLQGVIIVAALAIVAYMVAHEEGKIAAIDQ